MIPLVVVTGFLGSGKTTLLKQLARQAKRRRLAFLVNDFSAIDVDGEQLRQISDKVLAIPGGSIFCRCLAGDFIRVLENIPAQFDSGETPLDAVVVEASGITDPRVTAKLLHETRMDQIYELRRILTLIDPGSLYRLLATLPPIRRQIQAADTILINKIDVFTEEELAKTEAQVREINAGAELHRTAFCAIDFDALAAASERTEVEGDMAPCRDPDFASFELGVEGTLSCEKVTSILQEIGTDLFRVKGDILTERGAMHLEGTLGSLEWTPVLGKTVPENRGLAIIVYGPAEERVRSILDGVEH